MKQQSGFTLIEILITGFILGVGFLGLASIQSMGLQQSSNTYFRTQANTLAFDIADRMRANYIGTKNNGYNFAGGAAPAAQACFGSGANCTDAELAGYDLGEWYANVQLLPGGDASITQPTNTYYLIRIMWDEDRDGGATCADLQCLDLVVDL